VRAVHRRPLLRRHLGAVDRPRLAEAAEGGNIALVEEGDTIEIDIPNRRIHLAISDEELARRRSAMEAKGAAAWKPAAQRPRVITQALRAYAAMTTSAARGAVRDVSQVER
jgi:dihydroxy-acid dehydratase